MVVRKVERTPTNSVYAPLIPITVENVHILSVRYAAERFKALLQRNMELARIATLLKAGSSNREKNKKSCKVFCSEKNDNRAGVNKFKYPA